MTRLDLSWLVGKDASTAEIVTHLALAFIIGATMCGIRAMRNAERAVLAGMALLDVEDEEPLS